MAHPPAFVPTVVLAAGFPGAPGAPPDPAFEDLWAELQWEQARVLDARFIPVPEGDHFLQLDRPEVVIEAIREVLEAVRDSSAWTLSTPVPRTTGARQNPSPSPKKSEST
jgi:pimeloyl-ACP methyl ester carboxylesterase